MRRPFISLSLGGILAIAAGCLRAQGQDSPEIERLVTQTSDKVAKSQPKRVLIGARSGCLLNIQLCDSLESSLRANLEKSIQGIQFVNKEDVIQELKKHGFLSIDVYNDFVLRDIASNMGAEIVVMDNLFEVPHGYEVSRKIVNISTDTELATFKANTSRSSLENDDKPLLVKDAESEAWLVVPRSDPGHSRSPYYPACVKCPDPSIRRRLAGKAFKVLSIFL
jgi:hypothetical protein